MATTVEHRAMTRMARRTHEKLAREIGHQPTLDMLASQDGDYAGFDAFTLESAFAEYVQKHGMCEAVQLIAKQIARLS